MPILISNRQDKIPVSQELRELIERVIKQVFQTEKVNSFYEVAVILADDELVRELNRDYRGLDRPTDVLSFAYLEQGIKEPAPEVLLEDEPLGDIIISLETARLQAEEYEHALDREVGFLTVHGMLHLLGYDHQTEADQTVMRGKEETILKSLNLTR